jgi:hypothetical protein
MEDGKVHRLARLLVFTLLLCAVAFLFCSSLLVKRLELRPKMPREEDFTKYPIPEKFAYQVTKHGSGDISNGEKLQLPQSEGEFEETGQSIRLTDGEMGNILAKSKRKKQDMSGHGNNCGFYSILSQVKSASFGGDALSPYGNAHNDAERYVLGLRKTTETPGTTMINGEKMPKISTYYKCPVLVISDIGQIEISVPSATDAEIRMILSRYDFGENFDVWLTSYMGPQSKELPNLFDGVQRFASTIDIYRATVHEVVIALLLNPQTIGLFHVNGNHFQALQPLVPTN